MTKDGLTETEIYEICVALYSGGDCPAWMSTMDGTPNSASYEFLNRIEPVINGIIEQRVEATTKRYETTGLSVGAGHPARGRVMQIVNDVRIEYGEGMGTLGRIADRLIEVVESSHTPTWRELAALHAEQEQLRILWQRMAEQMMSEIMRVVGELEEARSTAVTHARDEALKEAIVMLRGMKFSK